MYQLNKVADSSHDEESEPDGLADFEEFPLVGFCASVHEEHSILDKLLGEIRELLEGV